VIDISPFVDPDGSPADRARVAREWDHAFRSIGFASVVGHGVPDALTTGVREAALSFFDLPLAQKQQCSFGGEKRSQGYFQVGLETVSRTLAPATDTVPPDLVETLTFAFVDWERDGPRSDFERSIFRPNLWPARPPQARASLQAYYDAVHGLAKTLMAVSAQALALPAGFFDRYYERMATSLRLAHYPPQAHPPLQGQLRYGAHTDYMGYTVLLQDEQFGGLQVLDAQDGWVDVAPLANAFTVNCGDLLARWTNGHWRSNVHRVVNPPCELAGTRRLSVVLFTGPDYESGIECIPTCVTAETPARFASIKCWDHFQEKVHASLV
jgi:isopenicillin N synthase-like dioxygenase